MLLPTSWSLSTLKALYRSSASSATPLLFENPWQGIEPKRPCNKSSGAWNPTSVWAPVRSLSRTKKKWRLRLILYICRCKISFVWDLVDFEALFFFTMGLWNFFLSDWSEPSLEGQSRKLFQKDLVWNLYLYDVTLGFCLQEWKCKWTFQRCKTKKLTNPSTLQS